MKKFLCPGCSEIFEAEGEKKEWTDRIYGYNWKYIAVSPCCKEESSEYKPPKQQKRTQPMSMPPGCEGCKNRSCGL
jgi:hypothetical protein